MRSLKTAMCSIFENKYGTSPKPIILFDAISKCWQPQILQDIRNCGYKSIRQQYLKGKLLAITPCSLQVGGRGEKFHQKHSGYLAFDIDGLAETMDKTFSKIVQIPYVAYCGKSASGNGLWGLIPIECPEFHNEYFEAMVQEFSSIGICLDPAPSSVASYRFLAYDPKAYFNDKAMVFEKRCGSKKVAFEPLNRELKWSTGRNLWQDFNKAADLNIINAILLNAGWKFHSHKGPKFRYTRPGKEVRDGLSAEYHSILKTFFVFSSEAPAAEFFINKGGGSPCDVLIHYAAGGDTKKAYQVLKSIVNF